MISIPNKCINSEQKRDDANAAIIEGFKSLYITNDADGGYLL